MNQTYKQSNQSIELVNKSGINYIDVLLNNRHGQPIRWMSDPTLSKKKGTTKITYSFPGLNGNNLLFNYNDDRGEISALSFTSEQAKDIRKIFTNISKYLNIEFIEIMEVEENVGTIRLALNTITDESGVHRQGIVATADPPSEEARGGDVWFNINYNTSNFSEGLVSGSLTGVGDITVMYHEIFHSLGLEHPEDNTAFPEDKNSREFTVMAAEFSNEGGASYFSSDHYVVASTPMLLDIVSLQYLYGANISYNSEDTTYSYNPNIPFIETIWDGGGNDTLDFSNFNKTNTINLSDGNSSTIGFNINWSMNNNLGIAYNAIIENAKGGAGADIITGNEYVNNIQGNSGDDIINSGAGDDFINGGEGDDEIDGGTGKDTASYSGNFSDYSLTARTNNYLIKDNRTGNNDGIDILKDIEYIKFLDQTLSISTNQNPTGITILSKSFNENIATDSIVATLSSADPDSSDTHTYSLVTGTGDTDNDSFTIDGSALKIKAYPDYETKSSYSIRLQTTDSGGETYTEVFTLSVNDLNEIPTALALSTTSFNENIAAASTVATLSSTDPDTSDTHTYSLVAGTGDTDNDSFTIDGSALKIKASADYETKSSYNIRLETSDSIGLGFQKAFTLSVKDLDEFVPTILGTSNNDNLIVTTADDSIDGGAGIDTVTFTGKFSDYSITRLIKYADLTLLDQLQIKDKRNIANDGTDTLKNIEFLQFTDQTVEESKVDVVKTYTGNFSDYKFYSKGNGVYQIKTDSGFDDITGYPSLKFTGESETSSFRDISAIVDIKGTFDQVTGLNTDDAKMFRLYNAAFKRLPDPDGLKYWIYNYSSGINNERAVASSFLISAEFKERYGENVSNAKYVETLYTNVLGRNYDQEGYNYWLGNLNSGLETRPELLLSFSESTENKGLFSEISGYF